MSSFNKLKNSREMNFLVVTSSLIFIYIIPGSVLFKMQNVFHAESSFPLTQVESDPDRSSVSFGQSGSMTVTNSPAPANVDLTTEGTNDWAVWGAKSAASFDYKSGVERQIGNYRKIGNSAVSSFRDGFVEYIWHKGNPSDSAKKSTSGIYVTGQDNGFEISIPAGRASRTLKIYVGIYAARGKLEVSLDDSPEARLIDTSAENQTDTSNRVYTINFQADSDERKLKVKWTAVKVFNQWGNVTLQAATLSGENPNNFSISEEFRISSTAKYDQFATHIAKNQNGDYVAVWQSNLQDGSGFGIFARKYNAAGIPVTDEFRVNTYTHDNQYVPRAALDADGNFVIIWESEHQDGSKYGIFGKRFNRDGEALGGEFRINTHTFDTQYDPAVAMSPKGDFVVVWTSAEQDGSSSGIFGQRFDAAGVRQGKEFRVNTYTLDSQEQSTISMDAAGNFVVGWESSEQDGSGKGIYGQRFDSSGVPQGKEFQVNTTTLGDQYWHWTAMSPTGEFLFVWCSSGQDGDSAGIFAQRFDSSGIPKGKEFQVNSTTVADQLYPVAAIDSNNNFVIIWESFGQDGQGKGIYGKFYDSSGIPQGNDFLINSYTKEDQSNPFTAIDANSNLTVIWTSKEQDGSDGGVFGKRFRIAGHNN